MSSTKRTTTILRTFLAAGLLGVCAASAATAHAQRAPLVRRMPAAAFTDLRRDVERARRADPRPFAVTADIVRRAPDRDARARGRKAPIALDLARLGPKTLLPMLEILAEASPPAGVPADAAEATRRDLIEAVGLLRDPRALPVLGAILDDTTEDEETTRTAAEAVARLGTDEAATRVIAALDAASGDPVRARAILGGMGECRRLRVAEAIAARLRAAPDAATAQVAARSLGRAGNAWAWKTLADRSEEAAVREAAARALVDAFVRHDGEARKAAAHALLVVDAPRTPALLAEARRSASPQTAAALDALAARFARNPAR